MKTLHCLFALICLLSCDNSSKNKVNSKFETISLETNITPKLSDFVDDDFDLVTLEMNEDCTIGIVNKVEIVDNEIFVLDAFISNSIFVFDLKGKFKRKIDNKGKGPGEYIQLYSFCTDKDKDLIYLLDNGSSKLLKYSLKEFKFKEEYKLPFDALSLTLSESGDLIFYCTQYTDKNYCYNVIVTSGNLTVKKKLIKQDKEKMHSVGMVSNNRGCMCNGYYVFNPTFSSEFYKLNKNYDLESYLKFDFGDIGMPTNDFFTSTSKVLKDLSRSEFVNHVDILETKEYIYLKYLQRRKEHVGIYSKKQDKILASCIAADIVDDIGILAFNSPDFVSGEYFISVLSSHSIVEKNTDPLKSDTHPKLHDLINRINEEANPILMIFKMK